MELSNVAINKKNTKQNEKQQDPMLLCRETEYQKRYSRLEAYIPTEF